MSSNKQTTPTVRFESLSKSVSEDLQVFRKEVKSLKKKQLSRVLLALTEYPVEQNVKLANEEELSVFKLGAKIKQDMVGMTVEYLNQEQKEKQDVKQKLD